MGGWPDKKNCVVDITNDTKLITSSELTHKRQINRKKTPEKPYRCCSDYCWEYSVHFIIWVSEVVLYTFHPNIYTKN